MIKYEKIGNRYIVTLDDGMTVVLTDNFTVLYLVDGESALIWKSLYAYKDFTSTKCSGLERKFLQNFISSYIIVKNE